MSKGLARIAEILCVDEVAINHGPKGVAVHVRVADVWHSAAIDNADLVKSKSPGDRRPAAVLRLEAIAEHLAFLADADIGKVRDPHKSQVDAATRAAFQAERELNRRRVWGSSWFDNPYDGPILRQITKSEAPAIPASNPVVLADSAAETMPSRFHAIMAELRCL